MFREPFSLPTINLLFKTIIFNENQCFYELIVTILKFLFPFLLIIH